MSRKMIKNDSRSLTRSVTERFVEAMYGIILKSKREGKGPATVKAFAESISANSTNFWQIEDPKMNRNVTLEMCCNICRVYKVDANWLLLGMANTYAKNGIEERLASLEQWRISVDLKPKALDKKAVEKSGRKNKKAMR